MDKKTDTKLVITGGIKLKGEVTAQGAKNAALPLMAASLLTDEEVVIHNVPDLIDIHTMCSLLKKVGATLSYDKHTLIIKPPTDPVLELPNKLVRKMRASSLLLGSMLSKYKKVLMPMPGGCAIGSRPIDLHIKGIKKLGAEVELEHGIVKAYVKDKLKGTRIYLDFPSVGATENLMMASVFAEGETIIENAAREPEIVNLALMLNKMGADIKGAGSGNIVIKGCKRLHGCEIDVIPDRIEAGTLLLAGVITGGDVVVRGVVSEYMSALLFKLEEAGVNVSYGDNWIRVRGGNRPQGIKLKTMPYPGFPTDLQPQMMAVLSIAEGTSIITEGIFENRFMHVHELKRMGALIDVSGNIAFVRGVDRLSGTKVKATDLRAGACLIIAGLSADGITEVYDMYHVDRGYEGFEHKLKTLGAEVKRKIVKGQNGI